MFLLQKRDSLVSKFIKVSHLSNKVRLYIAGPNRACVLFIRTRTTLFPGVCLCTRTLQYVNNVHVWVFQFSCITEQMRQWCSDNTIWEQAIEATLEKRWAITKQIQNAQNAELKVSKRILLTTAGIIKWDGFESLLEVNQLEMFSCKSRPQGSSYEEKFCRISWDLSQKISQNTI